jgi:hypothetical protein
MNVKVRHDVSEQQIVDMARLENAFDGSSDILNVRPVIGELVWRKIGEGRDMSAPKHHCHMAVRYGIPFEKSLADSAAVEGLAGQIGTKGASDTALARFPILRPGSFHLITPMLWSLLDLPNARFQPRRMIALAAGGCKSLLGRYGWRSRRLRWWIGHRCSHAQQTSGFRLQALSVDPRNEFLQILFPAWVKGLPKRVLRLDIRVADSPVELVRGAAPRTGPEANDTAPLLVGPLLGMLHEQSADSLASVGGVHHQSANHRERTGLQARDDHGVQPA